MRAGVTGDGQLALEGGLRPLAPVEHLQQVFHRVPDVLMAQVKRGETEAQNVGLPGVASAVVANHPAGNQGLHNRVRSFGPRQADL